MTSAPSDRIVRSGTIGIDDLNVDGGHMSVDLALVADARGLSARDLDAVQFHRRTVTAPYDDPVTMAVNAARPIVETAGRESFGLLLVATESGLDCGKPLSAYVHRYLNLPSSCRNLEMKYACYGGTAAIHAAVHWLRASAAADARALVVMTDLARRHFGDPAELSAGSGAVAVSIASHPRVLAIDSCAGYACREVFDVARPTPITEWGDAVLSLAAYLDLLEETWAAFQERAASRTGVEQRFRYMLYHTPLISLVQQAHALLLQQSTAEDLPPGAAQRSFDRMVAPALRYARELANVYSGSVYCLLAGLVEDVGAAPDTPIGIYSYGSGACAELYAGRIGWDATATVSRHGIGRGLAARQPLTFGEYEHLVKESEVMLTSREYDPAAEWPAPCARDTPRLVLERIRNHHRQYSWV